MIQKGELKALTEVQAMTSFCAATGLTPWHIKPTASVKSINANFFSRRWPATPCQRIICETPSAQPEGKCACASEKLSLYDKNGQPTGTRVSRIRPLVPSRGVRQNG